jgi:hypothetical protein
MLPNIVDCKVMKKVGIVGEIIHNMNKFVAQKTPALCT